MYTDKAMQIDKTTRYCSIIMIDI
uniref:Uncharacterized protein n=1 Tax=Anguilla anguilla TaxID=7936 RepID=A0A0E9VR17_ANGAN